MSGIKQVNNSINDMDAVTQQNSILVEKASAEAMNEKSNKHNTLVEFFNIDRSSNKEVQTDFPERRSE